MSTQPTLFPTKPLASPRPRVALLTLDFYPRVGGMQQYLFEISRRIGLNCDLTIVYPNGNPSLFSEEPFQLVSPEKDRGGPFSGSAVRSSWRILRMLGVLRPSIVVVGHAHPRLLLPAALSRRPYIALAYGNDFEAAQQRWHAPFFNRLLAGAQSLVTISRANARRFQDLGLPSPEILHPGTNPERFAPAPSPPQGPPVLLTVARLVPRKGIDTVLLALPPLLGRFPRLQYWIVGDGPSRESLARQTRQLGLQDAVRFMQNVTDTELPQIYRRAAIFVMPARADYYAGSVEGFGIVYLEASASGLPVVAARAGGAAEAVLENETGLLVPPDDPAALEQALARLLNDPGQRQRMGRAGRRWVEREMNWDRAGRQFMSIVERTL